jgi:hypothetical protein
VSVESGSYRSIKKPGDAAKVRWGEEKFERALTIALSIPARIRAGLFEPRAARSTAWKSYWPGLAISRVTARMEEGSRFDE